MPIVKFKTGTESEEESISSKPAAPSAALSGDLSRQATNMQLAQHIGNYIAGQVASQFQNESLADLMKGKNMVMVSGSWG